MDGWMDGVPRHSDPSLLSLSLSLPSRSLALARDRDGGGLCWLN